MKPDPPDLPHREELEVALLAAALVRVRRRLVVAAALEMLPRLMTVATECQPGSARTRSRALDKDSDRLKSNQRYDYGATLRVLDSLGQHAPAVETRGTAEHKRPERAKSSKSMSDPSRVTSTAPEQPERSTPLRRQLRSETAGLHHRLEAQLALVDPQLSVQRYRQVLQAFYGFYAPVEAGLERLAAAGPPLGFPLRARAALLESDLLALGGSRPDLAELPHCADLPRLLSHEDMAGCLYVLEGASLGGQVIAPMLQRRLGLAKGSGASFFGGDAEATAARWTCVLAWLEGLSAGGARADEIVASACATFRTLARWVNQQGASLGEMSWPT